MRRSIPVAVWLATLLLIGQVGLILAPARPVVSFLSVISIFLLALVACIGCLGAAARAQSVIRSGWRAASLSFALWAGAVVVELLRGWLFPHNHAVLLLAQSLFFFSLTPIFAAVLGLLTPNRQDSCWGCLADLLQLVLVLLAIFLILVVVPALILGEQRAAQYWLNAVTLRNIALLAAFVARLLADRQQATWRTLEPGFFALLFYAVSTYRSQRGEDLQNFLAADAHTLTWALPLAIIAIWAARWREEPAKPFNTGYASPVRMLWLYIIPSASLPLLLLAMRDNIAWQQILMGMVILFFSVVLFGARQVLLFRQQEKVTEELKRSEDRYRSLFERNLAGVYRATLGGRILDCNQAAADMLCYTREELQRVPCEVLYDGTAEERGARLRAGLLNGARHSRNVEVRYRRKDGSIAWTLQNINLVQDEVQGEDVLEGTIIDNTERRALEIQLRQAQKMEAIGRLAGGIAHDFNNLLTVISGYSQMQMDQTQTGTAMHDHAEQVYEAAKRAAQLTRQLLAFSRQQVMQPQMVSLSKVVGNLEKMLRRLIGEDVQLQILLAPTVGLVRLDVAQMEQVVLNLVVNARDAMPRGGTLTLRTANVHLEEQAARELGGVEAGDYAELTASDTGIGMESNVLAQIFEPFFTTKEEGKGTGLGLSTVYGIVRQSGGQISVESIPKKGTTFRLLFPIVEASASKSQPPTAKPSGLRGRETLLVVEDDDSLREVTRAVLSLQGYRVLVAAHAGQLEQAMEQVGDQLDLLLTDIVMPRTNGMEVADRLKQRWPHLRVLFMSGYANDLASRGVIPAGAHFLPKPFNPEILLRKVREVLDLKLASDTPSAKRTTLGT